jgi:glycosyltransferase involved in cell wall biosynthesis
MLLSNAFRPDPRVQREAQALAQSGYKVTIICWDREGKLPARETTGGVTIVRVHKVRSAYGAGPMQLLRLPRFWTEAARLASDLRPDLVYCHDLDTLYAGWRLKRRLGCPLIYDAHEHYPALMSLYLPAPFVWGLARWERWLLRQVDGVVTASSVLRDEFAAQGVRPAITLGNFQDVEPYAAVSQVEAAALRSDLGVPADQLLVAYIGGFSRNRELLPLIDAASRLPDVSVHLWGDGAQRAAVEQAAAGQPNVTYHGWLAEADLPRAFAAADVIVYCLRVDYPGAVYNAPNTLSQAMAAGRPIVANDVGDLGRMVRAADCGVLLHQATAEAIAAAIDQLRDPALRRRLGANGRHAAQSTYNAQALQSQLAELVAAVLNPRNAA